MKNNLAHSVTQLLTFLFIFNGVREPQAVCQAAQSIRKSQSLSKSVASQLEKREILKNAPLHKRTLKMKSKIKHERTTMAIRNAGEIADMKVITFNKLTAKRKVK